ncbi:hypothetical protein Btru_002817 [Bulinus truncatus]|nr:hypothetical protein Btru_002817 [Bulinus truncatus]
MESVKKGCSRHRFKKKSDEHCHENNTSKRKKTNDAALDKDSPIFKAFSIFQEELDNRNNRYERIVKISRDITIESKRIIFLLQRVTGSDESEKIFAEAQAKIADMNKTKFLALAQELQGQDFYQYHRAFSPGLQEYVEAVTFYNYLISEELVALDKIQANLVFSVKETDDESVTNTTMLVVNMSDLSTTINHKCDSTSDSSISRFKETAFFDIKSITAPLPPIDYMLGVADFTGELMRMAINSVGVGDLDKPSDVVCMMRLIFDAFITFAHPPRELRHKIKVLKQSLQKVETACYNLRVRGSELPKHMLADVFTFTTTCMGDTYSEELSDD